MLLVAHRFSQVLVEKLAHLLPHWCLCLNQHAAAGIECLLVCSKLPYVVLPQYVIAFRDQILTDQIDRSIRADGRPLVEDLANESSVGQHDSCGGPELDAEDAAVRLAPFCESGASR